jgi:methyltransferase (TIGR00027 family)
MSENAEPLLRNVSDTALWVACYRAEESERKDALFKDPFARRLAGERGFRLLDKMPKGRRYGWPMVMRTVLFDEFVPAKVRAGADVVLNLAAGLDTRPYRMALPKELLWVEVDLPGMVDYKTGILKGETPVCRLERVALDLSDAAERRHLLASVASRGKNVVVLSEGLLVYLEPDDVAALAANLSAQPSIRSWVTDIASPGLKKLMMKTWGTSVAEANAPFKFAPDEGPAWFAKHGWRVAAARSSFREAANRKRLPFPFKLFGIFPDPKTWKPQRIWGGTLLLERAG